MISRLNFVRFISSRQAQVTISSSAIVKSRDTHFFLFEKYAKTVPELQELINIILRSKGKNRASQILPKDVVTSFCGRYQSLPQNNRGELLNALALSYIPSPVDISNFYNRYQLALGKTPLQDPHKDAKAYDRLREDLKPMYESLFEAVVADLDGGIAFMVKLRADLHNLMAQRNSKTTIGKTPAPHHLQVMDSSVQAQLQSWFTPGLLQLCRITFEDSSGALLEKIAKLEAVHEVKDLRQLKERLGHGRRCFAFIHPCMPGEPLVFVHIALLPTLAHTMQYISDATGPGTDEKTSDCAIFYSITSTQTGLKGVDLGNLLIKRVVRQLQQELPQLSIFSTLSPIPKLIQWIELKSHQHAKLGTLQFNQGPIRETLLSSSDVEDLCALCKCEPEQAIDSMISLIRQPEWYRFQSSVTILKPILLRLAARYICTQKNRSKLLCPVGNFHVSNGAGIERINWLADLSDKGMRQSGGIMVNYKYTLDMIDANSDAYLTRGDVSIGPQVLQLLS